MPASSPSLAFRDRPQPLARRALRRPAPSIRTTCFFLKKSGARRDGGICARARGATGGAACTEQPRHGDAYLATQGSGADEDSRGTMRLALSKVYIVVACIGMAYIVLACIITAETVMACIVMAYVVMARTTGSGCGSATCCHRRTSRPPPSPWINLDTTMFYATTI